MAVRRSVMLVNSVIGITVDHRAEILGLGFPQKLQKVCSAFPSGKKSPVLVLRWGSFACVSNRKKASATRVLGVSVAKGDGSHRWRVCVCVLGLALLWLHVEDRCRGLEWTLGDWRRLFHTLGPGGCAQKRAVGNWGNEAGVISLTAPWVCTHHSANFLHILHMERVKIRKDHLKEQEKAI